MYEDIEKEERNGFLPLTGFIGFDAEPLYLRIIVNSHKVSTEGLIIKPAVLKCPKNYMLFMHPRLIHAGMFVVHFIDSYWALNFYGFFPT